MPAKRLTEELESPARREGARLFGVGPVERFKGAPRGHHPLDLTWPGRWRVLTN